VRPQPREDDRAEEHEWIVRSRRGDREAFRCLVERYQDPVFETALRIVRTREDAEEAAQDAFLLAWRALGDFREDARFSTWLYRIVTRRALDLAERAKRRGHEPLAAVESVAASNAGELATTDRARLERILRLLLPIQRAVVTLYYLRELAVDEIAAILSIPTGTVKSHLYRSRATLRELWLRERKRDGLQSL
jgi:RNA polymerase sigma-70 factor (ECF subfamily)